MRAWMIVGLSVSLAWGSLANADEGLPPAVTVEPTPAFATHYVGLPFGGAYRGHHVPSPAIANTCGCAGPDNPYAATLWDGYQRPFHPVASRVAQPGCGPAGCHAFHTHVGHHGPAPAWGWGGASAIGAGVGTPDGCGCAGH